MKNESVLEDLIERYSIFQFIYGLTSWRKIGLLFYEDSASVTSFGLQRRVHLLKGTPVCCQD